MTTIQEPVENLLTGFDQAIELILHTYGAEGGQVLMAGGAERTGYDDGFQVIKRYRPAGVIEREAVRLLIDAATAQHGSSGDGTTTCMILTAALAKAGCADRKKMSKSNVIAAYQDAIDKLIAHLRDLTRTDITEKTICDVATLSMHGNREYGDLIGGLAYRLGPHGTSTATAKPDGEIEVVEEEGFVWPGGILDDTMLNTGSRTKLKDVLVVMMNGIYENIDTTWWRNILECWQKKQRRDDKTYTLLLVCQQASGTVASTFSRKPNMAIVTTPRNIPTMNFFDDLVAVIGGKVVDPLRGTMEHEFDESFFGYVENFVGAKPFSCVKMDDALKALCVKRSAEVEDLYKDPTLSNNQGYLEVMKARLACLSGRVGEIRVPYISETSFNAVKEVVEDGFTAAKAALKGTVPGGGVAVARWAAIAKAFAAASVDPETEHVPIGVFDALMQPMFNNYRITHASDLALMAEDLRDNLGPHEIIDIFPPKFIDAYEAAVIDPAEVIINSILNAWSIAKQVIDTNIVLSHHDD